jgi:demethylmenaquinone methyltransferase / 2-methoxy-6-polyprenyl-1,4-benzoquinol methylase
MSDTPEKNTHFGFSFVPQHEKINKVRDVFDSVADRYDVMNDLMSFGLHRLWKWVAIEIARIKPGQCVLDIAAGTGDLSERIAKIIKNNGELWVTDINAAMLEKARARLVNHGHFNQLYFTQADAETLPFPQSYFDRIIIAFGLRNVTEQDNALRSMMRVLKPGGRLVILEFSKPTTPWLQQLYDRYSFKVIPALGEWVTQDRASYQYLVESIRMHPDQETLKQMLLNAGADDVEYYNLLGGIVSIHCGCKYA